MAIHSLLAQYGARTAGLTTDIIETMGSFDPEFAMMNGGRGSYYEPYLDYCAPSTGGQTPFNMQKSAGQTYIALWLATGDQRFRDRAEALATTLKAELTPVGDRYQWRYAPYNSVGSVSDIGHASADVNFVIQAYEAGIVFDDTDTQRMANTMRHIQKGSGFTANLDGVGVGEVSNSQLASLWIGLTHYDAALRQEMYPVFKDHYWSGNSGVFPSLGAATFYERGQTYLPEIGYNEAFDGLQLDRRWRRPTTQPIGDTWTTQVSDSQLIVSDIQTNSTSDQWVDIIRTRDVVQDDSWQVTFEFSWDSADDGADPLEVMQRFFVELRNPADDLIAKVGLDDGWNQSAGRRVIELFNESIIEPAGSIALTGSALVKILSDASLGVSSAYWNDVLMLSVPQLFDLQQVSMQTGYFSSVVAPTHFGTIAVDSIAVEEAMLGLLADYDESGTVDSSDYTQWLANLGAIEALPNDTSAGVDLDDYIRWKNNYGRSSSTGTAISLIPEPMTLFSVLSALLLGSMWRQRESVSEPYLENSRDPIRNSTIAKQRLRRTRFTL